MISRIGIITMLLTLFLSSCAPTKPIVWTKQDASFNSFRLFELKPVYNATGKDDKQEITSLLTAYLKEQFANQNLQLNNDPQIKDEVLVVQSNLVNFGFRYISTTAITVAQRRNTRITYLVLDTYLVNKSKGYNVAKITTNREVSYFQYTDNTVDWLLKETAVAVAKEVVEIMQTKNPERDKDIGQQL